MPKTSRKVENEGAVKSQLVTVHELTKKQARRALQMLGLSNAGPRNELIERLSKHLPEGCKFALFETLLEYMVDEDGRTILWEEMAVPAKVVEEPKEKPGQLEERFPNCKIVTDVKELGRRPIVRVLAPKVYNTINRARKLSEVEHLSNISGLANDLLKNCNIYESIALVIGRSGAGKSSFLSECKNRLGVDRGNDDEGLPGDNFVWDRKKAVISQFGTDGSAVKWLMAAGLCSVPSWCKPYHILSTGERFRAGLAKALQNSYESQVPLILDQFTSHLDRTTAMVCSAGLAKQLRRVKMGAILSTSSQDMIQWIEPDFIVDLGFGLTQPTIIRLKSKTHGGPSVRIKISRTGVCSPIVNSVEDPESPKLGSIPGSVLDNIETEEQLKRAFRHNIEEEESSGCCNVRNGTILHCNIDVDQSTEMCDKLFDRAFSGQCSLHVPEFGEAHLTQPFTTGLITGKSGSAKSVILRTYFGHPSEVEWNDSLNLEDHFKSPLEAKIKLDTVCLPFDDFHLRSFNELSCGEKERASLARLLDEKNVCIDEFTSVLDRSLAKTLSKNISSYLSQHNKNAGFVFVTCHNDFVDALQPDWIYDTVCGFKLFAHSQYKVEIDDSNRQLDSDSNKRQPFFRPDGRETVTMLDTPSIELTLQRCEPWVWALFRDHHYKTKSLSPKARTFVLRHGSTLVGFIASIQQVGKHDKDQMSTGSNKRAKTQGTENTTVSSWRAHRTVVLPSWQGLGVGSRLSDACAEIHRQTGSVYLAQTVHPRFGEYRDNSPFWTPSEWNHTTQNYKIESWKQRMENVRVKLRVPKFIFAHKYVGPICKDTEELFNSRVWFSE